MAQQSETTKTSDSKARIFISYSRKDTAFVDRLEAALKLHGFEALIDREEIYAFEDWWKRIQGLISKADTVVFVLSPDSVASQVCAKEVAQAAAFNKRFAPIVCRRVDDSAVPDALRRLNFIFFDDPDRFDTAVNQLADALKTHIEWIRQHTEFGETAQRWCSTGRPAGLLLRSPALEEAETWIASRPANAPAPTDETQAFIAASRRSATRRRDILTGSLAAGLFIALAFAGAAYWQKLAADEQRHQVVKEEMKRRAALAQQLATAGHMQAATAVALEALGTGGADQAPTDELKAVIHRTLNLTRVPLERYIGENVFSLAMSPDGHTLAAGTTDGMIHILDASTLASRFDVKAGSDVVSSLDFSPDGKQLLAAGDKIPSVWNVTTGAKLFDLQRPNATGFAPRARFSPDGSRIVVSSVENRAFLYAAATGELLYPLQGASYEEMRERWRTLPSTNGFGVADPIVDVVNQANFRMWGAATDAVFSPDGKVVAVTGQANPDGSVRLFDVATGTLLRTLTGGHGAGMVPPLSYGDTLTFSRDGSSLIAAPLGTTIKVWNAQNGQLRGEYPTPGIVSFALTVDSQAAVTTQDNGSIAFVCLTQNWTIVRPQAHDGSIDSLVVDRQGKRFATGSVDLQARVWSMPNGADICEFDRPANNAFAILSALQPLVTLAGHGARISKALLSDDGRSLTTASQDGWVRKWPIGPDADSTAIALPTADQAFDRREVLVSDDSRTIFARDDDGRWHAWDTASGKAIELPNDVATIAPGDKDHGPVLFKTPLSHVALSAALPGQDTERSFGFSIWHGPVSAGGSRVVADERSIEKKAGIDETDGAASVLVDTATNQVLARLVADGRAAQDLFFSPDGTRLFGRLEKRANAPGNQTGDGLAAWDAGTGKLIGVVATVSDYSPTSTKSLSQNGGRLLLGLNGSELALFDVGKDGFKQIEDIPDTGTSLTNGRSLTTSTLSPDGSYLLVGRSDGTVLATAIDRRAARFVLDTQSLPIQMIASSQDGRYTAIVDRSNTVWLFDSSNARPLRSKTLSTPIKALIFLPNAERLAILDRDELTIMPVTAAFAGQTDTPSIVDAARKLGLNLVSAEDQLRYELGASAPRNRARRTSCGQRPTRRPGLTRARTVNKPAPQRALQIRR